MSDRQELERDLLNWPMREQAKTLVEILRNNDGHLVRQKVVQLAIILGYERGYAVRDAGATCGELTRSRDTPFRYVKSIL